MPASNNDKTRAEIEVRLQKVQALSYSYRMQLKDLEQQNIVLFMLLADIRAACGDDGLRMQDDLVRYIQSGFDELKMLRARKAGE